MAPYIGWFVQILVFLMISLLFWSILCSEEDISMKLIPLSIIIPMWFISLCISIYPLFLWNTKLKKIYDLIFEFPITFILKLLLLQTNVFMIVMFIVICLIPVGLTVAIIPEDWQFKWGTVYVVSLLVLLIYSYKSQWIMSFLNYIFNNGIRDKQLLVKTLDKVNPRIFSYSMMIIIYVIYNFDTFSNSSLEIDINLMKEVFVTFIAVDTLIQLFKKDTITSNISND